MTPPRKSAQKSRSKSTSTKSTSKSKAAPRKRSTKKATASAARKKASASKSSPRKRSSRKPVTSKAPPAKASWRSFLIKEGITWSLGIAAGALITGGLLWMRAKGDVAAYIADPPRTVPGVIWSAPITVEAGQRASMSSIAGDLLAAGYERVDRISESHSTRAGEFAVKADGLDIWTNPMDGVPGGRTRLVLEDGRVTGGAPAVLRPTVLATIGEWDGRRDPIDLDVVSPHLEPALLSMEDQRFREHAGIDPWGIARAVLHNVMGGGGQGGSTLTQQLAKNLFLSSERTLRRKVREAFFAAALESELSKDELLELYLQEVYLGQMGGVPLYGVEAAGLAWFGKSPARLELHEVATIIGVIPAPNRYNPRRHPETAEERRNLVIDQMARNGAISDDEATPRKPSLSSCPAPCRARSAARPGPSTSLSTMPSGTSGEGALASQGIHVHTAIQPLLQRAAEEAVADGMAELDAEYPKSAGAQVALAAVRVSDGAIVALVGSRNYAESRRSTGPHTHGVRPAPPSSRSPCWRRSTRTAT
jgi:penicillin-binding protein 1B